MTMALISFDIEGLQTFTVSWRNARASKPEESKPTASARTNAKLFLISLIFFEGSENPRHGTLEAPEIRRTQGTAV